MMDGLQPQLNFAPLLLMIWMTSTIISLHGKRRTPFAPGSKKIVEIVDNYPANEPFLRKRQSNSQGALRAPNRPLEEP
jgi:hypothetical protein